MKICLQCGKEFEPKRETAVFCSSACRVKNSRQVPEISGDAPQTQISSEKAPKQEQFTFTVPTNDTPRIAKYWYDVPLSAIPQVKRGWPQHPSYMNGRQYFLWFRNSWKVDESGQPIILNPYK